ncbi:HalOD1 output domain-containing protein [Halorubrum sp. HHNYT27]|uniref:HalOD1 output domain-containing protein n=1 Tax=Halorubrum sp. HHNYT27 TaxID=3402275 RepID=UPI003EBA2873
MTLRGSGIILESFTFYSNSETYLARYDQAETPASMAVISTLAEILDVDPTDMDPLFHSVDTESLDALLGKATDGDVRVTSTLAGHEVTVTGNSVSASRAPDDDNEPVVIEKVSPT